MSDEGASLQRATELLQEPGFMASPRGTGAQWVYFYPLHELWLQGDVKGPGEYL